MKKYKNELWIFVGSVALYLLFNWRLPITDPVESNYALTAKEMLLSGDYLSTRIYGAYWYDKPVWVYWMLIGSFKLFGINAFAARFPMAVASGVSLAFLYWFTEKVYGRRIAWLSVGVLMTSLEFWVVGKMVITDSFLFLFDSVALGLFYLAIRTRREAYCIISYAASGLAVLTKGPVGIVLPGLIIAAYLLAAREWQPLRHLYFWRGMGIFLVVALPWYLYMVIVHGGDFIAGFFGLHNFTRATVPEHPSANVLYYYLVVVPLSVLPWSGLLFKSFCEMGKERSGDKRTLFLGSWAVVTMLFYTLVATKYITYTFIALFPCAVFMAVSLETMLREGAGRKAWLWITLPVMLVFASLFFAAAYLPEGGRYSVRALLALLFVCILYLQVKGSGSQLIAGTVFGLCFLIAGLCGSALPYFAGLRTSDVAAVLPNDPNAKIAIYGAYETSAVFYSGHEIIQLEEGNAPPRAWSGKYTMPRRTMADFLRLAERNDLVYLIVPARKQMDFLKADTAQLYRLVWTGPNEALYQKFK